MRISDWSSDVCSSDLDEPVLFVEQLGGLGPSHADRPAEQEAGLEDIGPIAAALLRDEAIGVPEQRQRTVETLIARHTWHRSPSTCFRPSPPLRGAKTVQHKKGHPADKLPVTTVEYGPADGPKGENNQNTNPP